MMVTSDSFISFRAAAIGGVLLAGASVATTATAQVQAAADSAASPSAQDSSAQIAEIVVTAQKRSQSLMDVPISIAAVGESELRQQGVASTADLARVVPGLTAAPSPYNTPVYNLRGVGFYDSALSAAPTVAVYTDEVPLPFSAMTTAAGLDVQRVEVLKGPQGTLFGNSTTGGAINYIANKPTDAFAAGADVSYGRFNTADVQGFVSGPIAANTEARLAVRSVESSDWQYSQSRPYDTLGAQRIFQSRLLVNWSGVDNLKVVFNLNGWIDNSDTVAAQLEKIVPGNPASPLVPALLTLQPAPANDRAADWSPNDGYGGYRKDDYFLQAAIRADYEVNSALTITSITAGEKYRGIANSAFDGTDVHISDVQPTGHINTISQELRAAGSSGPFTYVAGGNYERDITQDKLDFNFADATASTVGPYTISRTGNYSDQNITTLAGFANLEYAITHQITAVGGARYTDTSRSFVGCSQDFGPPFNTNVAFNFIQSIYRTSGFDFIGPGDCWTFRPGYIPYVKDRVVDRLDQGNVSWHAGLNYTTDSRGLIYASVSKGYKAGGFPTTTATSDVQYKPVTQESLLAEEIGIKQPLFENRLQLVGAVFYYDYKDKQIQGKVDDPIFGPLNALVNVPQSHVLGAESQIVARPVSNYSISIAGTYLQTKITKFTGVNSAGVDQDFSGSPVPYAPKWQIFADNQYEFSIGSWQNLFVGADVSYHSETNASIGAPYDYRIPAYFLVGVRAGMKWADDHWTAQLWGRNITDRYYWNNVVLFNDALVRYAGTPATYGISVSYRY